MAKAIYDKRKFTNNQTGETVNYEVYGILAMVDGERMELALKNLSPAEKIAFKMLMTGSDVDDITTVSRKADATETTAFIEKNSTSNWIDELES